MDLLPTGGNTNNGRYLNPFEHTAGCETVETSMSFACNSSFLSVDGMTCLTPFQSLRNNLSNGMSYVEIVSIFRL